MREGVSTVEGRPFRVGTELMQPLFVVGEKELLVMVQSPHKSG